MEDFNALMLTMILQQSVPSLQLIDAAFYFLRRSYEQGNQFVPAAPSCNREWECKWEADCQLQVEVQRRESALVGLEHFLGWLAEACHAPTISLYVRKTYPDHVAYLQAVHPHITLQVALQNDEYPLFCGQGRHHSPVRYVPCRLAHCHRIASQEEVQFGLFLLL